MLKCGFGASPLGAASRNPIGDLVAHVRQKEEQWWARLQEEEVALIRQLKEKGYEPASMRFYGELLFVLLGLKPAMLFTGFEGHRNVMKDYINCVLIASGVLVVNSISLFLTNSQIISLNVGTFLGGGAFRMRMEHQDPRWALSWSSGVALWKQTWRQATITSKEVS